MKLTAKARMAVTAMADLAANGGTAPVSLGDIAERRSLSLAFLEQVFAKLRRAGLVESRRGAGGGYILAQEAESVTIADVVRAIDEEFKATGCDPASSVGCTGGERCLTHALWFGLDKTIERYLEGVTLANVARSAKVDEHA